MKLDIRYFSAFDVEHGKVKLEAPCAVQEAGWYWFDETYKMWSGPFDTENECRQNHACASLFLGSK